jgi:hypothetical protein
MLHYAIVSRYSQNLPLAADVNHAAGRLHKSGFSDVVARFFLLNDSFNVRSHLGVGRSSLHQGVEIVIKKREQASAKLSVRGDPDTGTMSAERMGHRSNDADLTDAIFKRITASRLAGDVGSESPQWLPC